MHRILAKGDTRAKNSEVNSQHYGRVPTVHSEQRARSVCILNKASNGKGLRRGSCLRHATLSCRQCHTRESMDLVQGDENAEEVRTRTR